MSQQQKLEQVLDLLLSEDSGPAAELLHQIIVEKARTIYESMVNEDEDGNPFDKDTVGGEPNDDFTKDISADKDDINSDEESDGEVDDDADADDNTDADVADDEVEGSTEDRVEDLESQLAELRAEFDALMGEEMQEPNHQDLGNEFDSNDASDVDGGAVEGPDFGGNEQVVGEVVATMYEKKKGSKLEVAPQAKDKKKDKKVDEETQFLTRVADTGQRGTAKLVGTGKDTPLGAEQTKSLYTNAPNKKDYGGVPTKIGTGTGGEYGKYNGSTAQNKTPTDNVNVKGKNSSIKADTTAKFTGGAPAGEGFNKSPFSKKPV